MSTLTYKNAGVDIVAGNQFVEKIKQDIAATKQPWVLSEIGLFGGMIDLRMACQGFENPVLIQVVNGLSRDTVGYDNLSYNSLGCQIVCGCLEKLSSVVKFKPISFLDYIGSYRLLIDSHNRLIQGMSAACRKHQIPIVGGETAEMPVIYNLYCMSVVGALTAVIEKKDANKINQRYKGIRALPLLPIFEAYKKPVLIQSIDGLGTKSKEQEFLGDSIRDILNHCKNDIGVHGAWPRRALVYIDANSRYQWNVFKKTGRVIENEAMQKAVGWWHKPGSYIIDGNLLIDYELVIKEHPGIFQRGQMDLVCAISGLVEYDRLINGSTIGPEDVLIGLPSAGLHTNGFSLARKMSASLLEEMRKPHLSYLKPLNALNDAKLLKGAAHITGGGIPCNLVRILPKNCRAIIKKGAWPILPVFKFIQEKGSVDEEEMFKVFNMGIGIILVISNDNFIAVNKELKKIHQSHYVIGEVIKGERGVETI